MKEKHSLYIGLSIIIAMFILAVYYYPIMPERMAAHFNTHGIPDSFIGKFWGVFFVPLLSVLLFALFIAIPHIDPLGRNIREFRIYYDVFVALFLPFMFYIELAIILWNAGIRLNLLRFISVPVGLLYVYLGRLLLKSKRNWFIGIKTPWTLSNDEVWEKTNKLGGWFFMIDGVLVMLSFLIGKFILFFMIWSVLLVMLVVVVYSYLLWTKVKYEEENS